MKKNIVIVIIVVIVAMIGGGVLLFMKLGNSLNVNNSPVNLKTNATNQTANANTNEAVNQIANIVTNAETTVSGTVFVKGYGTPSESYGVLTTDDSEVGLGKYDSMKEQFRPYVGDKVQVTFSNICRSTSADCCLTVFYYCGTVKTWEPLTTNN